MSEDLLKALLGAAQAQSGGQQEQGADPLAGMLGSLLGGGASQPGAGATGTDPLAGMLGSLLGGAAGEQGAGVPAQGGADMGSLLQVLLGGAGAAPAAQAQAEAAPTDLLGALLGGGQAGVQASPQMGGLGGILQPILQGLAQNLGLSPQIAQIVVTFVLGTLLTGQIGGAAPGTATASTRRAQPPSPGPGRAPRQDLQRSGGEHQLPPLHRHGAGADQAERPGPAHGDAEPAAGARLAGRHHGWPGAGLNRRTSRHRRPSASTPFPLVGRG